MGPQHPPPLRLILEIEAGPSPRPAAESATCTPASRRTSNTAPGPGRPFVTRMDYLAPFFNETAYCLGVEKLLGVTDDISSAPLSFA